MKRLLSATLLVAALTTLAPAQAVTPRLYYYDGNAPMITFMLEMMRAMGLIKRIPPGYLQQLNLSRNIDRYRWLYPQLYRDSLRGTYSGIPGEYQRGGMPYAGSEYGCESVRCLRRATLDGVWLNSDGEILGIRQDRMVWSDGDRAYARGTIQTTPGYIYARFNEARSSTPYSYTIAGNQLNLRDADGSVRRFYRLPGTDR